MGLHEDYQTDFVFLRQIWLKSDALSIIFTIFVIKI